MLSVVDDEAGLAALRDEWDALLARSRQDSPFLRHEWLSAWWRAFRGDDELSVLLCREEGTRRLIGVLPLLTCRRGILLRARTARFLGDIGAGSTRLSAFAEPDAEDAVFTLFAQALRAEESGWDVLDLRFMDREGTFLPRVCSGSGVRVFHESGLCPRIALPADWDTYLSRLSKHMRHEVRRQRKRAAERGFEPEVVRHAAELPAAVDDFLRLHVDRMRHSVDPSFDVSDAFRRFTLETAATMLAEDRLRLTFLGREGRRSAVLHLFRYGDTMYALQSAFDETDAKQDVGRALWSHAIQGAIEEGCTSLDMLLGDQRYKFEWGVTDVLHLSEVHVYNGSLASEMRRARDVVTAWQRSRLAARSPQALLQPAGGDAGQPVR